MPQPVLSPHARGGVRDVFVPHLAGELAGRAAGRAGRRTRQRNRADADWPDVLAEVAKLYPGAYRTTRDWRPARHVARQRGGIRGGATPWRAGTAVAERIHIRPHGGAYD